MIWPSVGIYPDLNPSEYFALTEIDGVIVRSNSTLKAFDQDPALFNAGHRKAPTKAMTAGSLFDCLLTSPARFDEEFVVSPHAEFKTKEAKAWKAEQTKTVIKPNELALAVESIKAIQSDPRWQAITAGNCGFQVGMRVNIDGVPFKALVDVLPDKDGEYGDAIVDVKRFGSMDTLEDVLKNCRKFQYNYQGGLYRGMARMLGEKRNRYLLYIVPTNPPITPCLIELGENMLATGAHAILRMSHRMAECEETGIWPGRFDGIKRVDQSEEGWGWKEIEDELDATPTAETP
jgi:PDDEXK-like domain of unknown function (DUF3799)